MKLKYMKIFLINIKVTAIFRHLFSFFFKYHTKCGTILYSGRFQTSCTDTYRQNRFDGLYETDSIYVDWLIIVVIHGVTLRSM